MHSATFIAIAFIPLVASQCIPGGQNTGVCDFNCGMAQSDNRCSGVTFIDRTGGDCKFLGTTIEFIYLNNLGCNQCTFFLLVHPVGVSLLAERVLMNDGSNGDCTGTSASFQPPPFDQHQFVPVNIEGGAQSYRCD